MRLNRLNEVADSRPVVTEFAGYNRTDTCRDGEWRDMEGITTDEYPTLAVRNRRGHMESALPSRKPLAMTVMDGKIYKLIQRKLWHEPESAPDPTTTAEGWHDDTDEYIETICLFEEDTPTDIYVPGVDFRGDFYAFNRLLIAYGEIKLTESGEWEQAAYVFDPIHEDGHGAEAINVVPMYGVADNQDGSVIGLASLTSATEDGMPYRMMANAHPESYYDTHDPQEDDIKIVTSGSGASYKEIYYQYKGGTWELLISYTVACLFGNMPKDIEVIMLDNWTDAKIIIPKHSFNIGNTTVNTNPAIFKDILKLQNWVEDDNYIVTSRADAGEGMGWSTRGAYIGHCKIRQTFNTVFKGTIDQPHRFGAVVSIQVNEDFEDGILGAAANTYVRFEREKPGENALVYPLVYNNRVWAGGADGHTIYASALGSALSWDDYSGISTDSYAATISAGTDFTGSVVYNDTPIFFKRDRMFKVYVSATGAHQIKEEVTKGIQAGSAKSAVVVNGVLYYKGENEVLAYTGSIPYSISDNFGLAKYTDATAAAFRDKYVITMKDEQGAWQTFSYDTKKGLWMHEGSFRMINPISHDNNLWYWDENGNLMKFDGSDIMTETSTTYREADTDWFCESGDITYNTPDAKSIDRISIRYQLGLRSRMAVYMSYDGGGWEHMASLQGTGMRTMTLPIRPKRCDHFRYKIVGHGYGKVFSISKTFREGSDIR